jgi:hypothetical protein
LILLLIRIIRPTLLLLLRGPLLITSLWIWSLLVRPLFIRSLLIGFLRIRPQFVRPLLTRSLLLLRSAFLHLLTGPGQLLRLLPLLLLPLIPCFLLFLLISFSRLFRVMWPTTSTNSGSTSLGLLVVTSTASSSSGIIFCWFSDRIFFTLSIVNGY